MRNRHLPRVCNQCDAPMASSDDACWRCGAEFATDDAAQPVALRVIPGGAAARTAPVATRAAAAKRA